MHNIQIARASQPRGLRTMPITSKKTTTQWSTQTADRMIAVRGQLAILMFSQLGRLSADEMLQLHSLKRELNELETLRNRHTKMRPTS